MSSTSVFVVTRNTREFAFTNINTDKPDLTAFKAHGGKLISYHGLADILIPPQG